MAYFNAMEFMAQFRATTDNVINFLEWEKKGKKDKPEYLRLAHFLFYFSASSMGSFSLKSGYAHKIKHLCAETI